MGSFFDPEVFAKILNPESQTPGTPLSPTNENPYPGDEGAPATYGSYVDQIAYQGTTGSTSAPASAAGASTGSPSVPALNKIPSPEDALAMLKLRSLK